MSVGDQGGIQSADETMHGSERSTVGASRRGTDRYFVVAERRQAPGAGPPIDQAAQGSQGDPSGLVKDVGRRSGLRAGRGHATGQPGAEGTGHKPRAREAMMICDPHPAVIDARSTISQLSPLSWTFVPCLRDEPRSGKSRPWRVIIGLGQLRPRALQLVSQGGKFLYERDAVGGQSVKLHSEPDGGVLELGAGLAIALSRGAQMVDFRAHATVTIPPRIALEHEPLPHLCAMTRPRQPAWLTPERREKLHAIGTRLLDGLTTEETHAPAAAPSLSAASAAQVGEILALLEDQVIGFEQRLAGFDAALAATREHAGALERRVAEAHGEAARLREESESLRREGERRERELESTTSALESALVDLAERQSGSGANRGLAAS